MKLLWLDLETTGLDPHTSQILEVAACVADLDRPFDASDTFEAVLSSSVTPDHVHPVVAEMHRKNGLWVACAESRTTLLEVEERLVAMAGGTQAADKEDRTTLAGSTVSFDLGFIRVHMPRLASLLHYRVYDVSSVVLFCRSLGMTRPARSEAHRAMADVRESIALARTCARWFSADSGQREEMRR